MKKAGCVFTYRFILLCTHNPFSPPATTTSQGESITPIMDGKRISAERHLTSLKTGLLLLMSLTPTITSAKLLRGVGPPEALSSIAVMFSVYCGPFRLGGGFLRSLMIPKFGSIKCHFILLCKQTKSREHHISLLLYFWFSLYFGCKA